MRKLSDAGQRVFDVRYAARDDNGNICETFEEAVWRLATCAASVEDNKEYWANLFAEVIGNLEFVPATPIWANMGKSDRPWMPGSCFVLDVDDSLDSMYETLKDTALVFKAGGGVGYNFSKIRPRGDLVHTTKGQASGVVELIRLYNASSNMVVQGGVRRGASMGIVNIDHPEVEDFIRCKLDGSITNFNLSVGVTDAFMDAVTNDADWGLTFNGKVYKTVKARYLWDLIAECAWACGDPGIVFLDAIQRNNPVPDRVINATNPCGEQPLYPGESCLLGSISLEKFVVNGEIDVGHLRKVTDIAVRFLDNMIDVAQYPLPIIEENTKATRKIGLGVTGLHDVLIMLGHCYDDKEGRTFARELLWVIQDEAESYSKILARAKGLFPIWENSIYNDKKGYPIRNAARITIAPTGSVTTLAGCEGYGIEPIFAVAYTKETEVAGAFEVFSPLFKQACEKHGVSAEAMSEAAKRGSCQGIKGIPEDIQRIFKGAQDIRPQDHILMQVELQRCVDNAISKTVNLPSSATVDDIKKIYRMAWEGLLKGVTVFRDGCKDGVITVGEGKKQEAPLKRGEIIPRPNDAQGITTCLETGCGKVYLTVNHQNGEIIETFITTGSNGGCLIYTEATSRLISLALRAGISVEDICEQLNSTHSCPSYQYARGKGKNVSPGRSCASAIANKLMEIKKTLNTEDVEVVTTEILCPECGAKMDRAEGCMVCKECGYSKC